VGVLIRKQKGVFIFTGIAKLAITGFILSLASSYIDTIWSVYVDSFVNSVIVVSLISSFLTVLSFLSYFLIIPVIERTNKIRIFMFSLIGYAFLYILFALNKNFYMFLFLAVILTFIVTIRITSFGIIIKDTSRKNRLARNEGLMYTFSNLAWLLGPLVAGFLAEIYNINLVFVLSAVFVLIALVFFNFSRMRDGHVKIKTDDNLLKNFFDFFKDKKRVLAYLLGGGVNFWWILIYLFMPLYMTRSGLDIEWVGIFLFAIAVPLIIFTYKFASLAGKVGFRRIFKIGFFIPAVLALVCFFVSNIFIIMGLLVLASIGLAMLESTTEAYFFDTLNGHQDLRFYGPYNTTIDVNQFVSKILPAIFLVFLPLKFIFLFFSLFMFVFFFLSFKTKRIVESHRKR